MSLPLVLRFRLPFALNHRVSILTLNSTPFSTRNISSCFQRFHFFSIIVGQPTVTKPSRSDEVLDADQQLQITNQVRAQFESWAPNRPTKPNRSEIDYSTTPSPSPYVPDQDDFTVPELDKLKYLQSQSHAIFLGTSPVVQEEFVETEYYKELHSIDKQHHTTGSGFIKVASDVDGIDYDLQVRGGNDGLENNHGGYRDMVFKTNPATNDWIPSLENYQLLYASTLGSC